MFLGKLINGLHLAEKPLYFLWWSLLLIVDSETDAPTSWRVFLTRERIHLFFSPLVLQVFWCCWAHQCVLSFHQTANWATSHVLSVFDRFVLTCFTDSDSSLDFILRIVFIRFQMNIPPLKQTLGLLSAPCKWNNEGIKHTWPWNSWAANSPVTFGPWKKVQGTCVVILTPSPDFVHVKHILTEHAVDVVPAFQVSHNILNHQQKPNHPSIGTQEKLQDLVTGGVVKEGIFSLDWPPHPSYHSA